MSGHEHLIENIASGECSKDNTQLLHKVLRDADNDMLRQLGKQLVKYNVYLKEGRDVHIGDKVYQIIDEDAVTKIVAAIQARYQELSLGQVKRKAPFQAPPLPIHYVDRPEIINKLKSSLILKKKFPVVSLQFHRH